MLPLIKDALKDRLYQEISNLGHAVTPRAYASGLDLASHLRQLFAFLEIDCVLDVGANEGQYRNFLRRRCGYTGLIVSYEPVAATFATLKKNSARDEKWLVFNHALGAENGTREFNVMRDTQFSSFSEPQATDICKPDMANVIDHRETVTVTRLETEIAELAGRTNPQRFYLKMDTQGHDLEVLKGAGSMLDRVLALQSEVAVKPIYQSIPDFTASISTIKSRGFELTGLFPVNRDDALRIIEFDCVAINYPRVAQMVLQRPADGNATNPLPAGRLFPADALPEPAIQA